MRERMGERYIERDREREKQRQRDREMVLYVIASGAFSWLLTQTKNQINKKFSSSKSSKLTQLIQNLSVKMFMFL